ncbi:MAG: type III-B CRISPR-associated protein Cas10/Cmr2 [Ktedonobacteraceae bacterium]
MGYLFLVNIGPVQDFIASARRTRDLAFGSWFLSELARAAAHEIVAHNGLDSLIFPAPANAAMLEPNNTDFLVPNKLIARIQQAPQEAGKHVRQAVMERLYSIQESAYNGGITSKGERKHPNIPFLPKERSMANAQVKDLVEFLWAALPFPNEAEYQQTRKDLEALMSARKNTRNFAPTTPWSGSVPKSSIGGQLESVIPKEAYPPFRASAQDKYVKISALYDKYGAGPAEQLSGVDLLKRRGVTAFGEQFPSTSHMAALPFLKRLENLPDQQREQARAAWNAYIAVVKELALEPLEYIPDRNPPHSVLGRHEGSMLLESRLTDMLYTPGDEKGNRERLQTVSQALQGFYQILDQQFADLHFPKARPEPYYALLQADGDGMGKIIDAQAVHGSEQHRKLSQQLSLFAGRAGKIVEDHRGALVYAGGDDVLALLSLDTVLECASELAEAFRTTLQEFVGQNGQTPSLSVGVAIAHHLDSLHSVRQLAKRAEDRAKGLTGKNALSITLSKSSGDDYHIVGHWKDLDRSLQQLIDFYGKEAIPMGTAYELRDLLLRLGSPTFETNKSMAEVMAQDAQRILQRKLNVPPGKFQPAQIKEIKCFFQARLDSEQEQQSDGEQKQAQPVNGSAQQSDGESIKPVSLEAFINELIVAKTLADAKLMAAPKKEKSPV